MWIYIHVRLVKIVTISDNHHDTTYILGAKISESSISVCLKITGCKLSLMLNSTMLFLFSDQCSSYAHAPICTPLDVLVLKLWYGQTHCWLTSFGEKTTGPLTNKTQSVNGRHII